MIGERTNVTGSKKFERLVKAKDWAGAATVAVDQVRGGANIIDVNMDEGMLDSEACMTEFLNYIAHRARDRARAGDGRQLEVVGDRSRPQVRAGQGGRQLDQPQGRRSGLPAQGEDHPPLRRGDDRDGVRRDGPGRHRRAQGRDLQARLQAADRDRPASIRPTSSSIRTSSRSRPASRSTTTTRSTSSRRRRSSSSSARA